MPVYSSVLGFLLVPKITIEKLMLLRVVHLVGVCSGCVCLPDQAGSSVSWQKENPSFKITSEQFSWNHWFSPGIVPHGCWLLLPTCGHNSIPRHCLVCFHSYRLVLRRTVLWKSIPEWPLICSLCRFRSVVLWLLRHLWCFQGCFIPRGSLPSNLSEPTTLTGFHLGLLVIKKLVHCPWSNFGFSSADHPFCSPTSPSSSPTYKASLACIQYFLLGKGNTLQITRQIPTPAVSKPQ